MAYIKLYPFFTGTITLDKSFLTLGRDYGQEITIPVPVFLIEHPKGIVLYDTGMHKSLIDDNGETGRWGPVVGAFKPFMNPGEDVVSRINELGFKPKDIKYVINSHLHLDHAGGNEFFPDSTFIVQKDEIRAAYWPEVYQKAAYWRIDFDHPLNYQTIEGDYDLFGDGTVQIWKTPGHTQGHQSLCLRLKNSGNYILTGDSCYLKESIEEFAIPSVIWSPDECIRSITRIRESREKLNAKVILGHDPGEWAGLRHSPEYYD